ncbi:MAG: hypothetical protein ACOCXP_02625 [Candidatus Dojkabacteria bacterium]
MIKKILWISLDTFIGFTAGNLSRILNFFIWEDSKSINMILHYNFFWVLFSLLGAVLSGTISSFFSPKFSYFLSRLLRALSAFIAFYNLENVSDYIFVLAALEGCANAFLISSRAVLDLGLFNVSGLQAVSSFREVINTLVRLLRPIAVTWMISSLGYEQSFLATIAIILAVSPFIFPFKFVGIPKQEFNLLSQLISIGNNYLERRIAIISFSTGVGYVFSLGLIDVLILEKLGSIEFWGAVSFLMALVGLIVISILKNVDASEVHKVAAVLGVVSFGYAALPLFLINEFSITLLLGFLVAESIFMNADRILGRTAMISAENKLLRSDTHRIASQSARDIYFSLGLLIPLALMLMLPSQYLEAEYLLIILALCTLFPFLNAGKYKGL